MDKESDEYKEILRYLIETADVPHHINDKNMDENERKEHAQTTKELTQDDLEGYYQVVNIYKVCRDEERKGFTKKIGNERLLYHGSRISVRNSSINQSSPYY